MPEFNFEPLARGEAEDAKAAPVDLATRIIDRLNQIGMALSESEGGGQDVALPGLTVTQNEGLQVGELVRVQSGFATRANANSADFATHVVASVDGRTARVVATADSIKVLLDGSLATGSRLYLSQFSGKATREEPALPGDLIQDVGFIIGAVSSSSAVAVVNLNSYLREVPAIA